MSKTPLDKVKIKKLPTYYRYFYYYYYVIFQGNFPVFTYNIFVKKQKREKKTKKMKLQPYGTFLTHL